MTIVVMMSRRMTAPTIIPSVQCHNKKYHNYYFIYKYIYIYIYIKINNINIYYLSLNYVMQNMYISNVNNNTIDY